MAKTTRGSRKYQVLGLMSGSSLDGLDLAFCEIQVEYKPDFAVTHSEILAAATVPFSEQWQVRLKNLPEQNALTFAKTNTYFAHYAADLVKDFCIKNKVKPDFIAAHGHTIFHQPENFLTVQIGDGAALAAKTGYPVVCDFRTHDVALHGEGTPLAPAADRWLYPGYDFYLNLGGIANISCKVEDKFIAFDTAPANQVFNALANLTGAEYDANGTLAAAGQVAADLLNVVHALPYFSANYPKSLDNTWIRNQVLPLYFSAQISLNDKIRTAVEQTAAQTAVEIKRVIDRENLPQKKRRMLVTGGGALNGFLVKRLRELCENTEIVLPSHLIINFKEAALMALLGVLRVENQPNCYASVTGSKYDSIGGAIYQGRKKII